ncbi:SGNH/GDSL hydrolase family protein [Dactylosporangium sp. AC04546]|uniref:SGNH/GDSL hydrolase family protein n=1 Tax=Dactylosporangium sp. AC04546 TaxID=2862460 RepID=UPI001EDEF000|nr:SGNH/GDSL hydrolase family protein [Dactylosporangium sp. AC04546]WVK82855.1 SGNH/GDSL hydrolase family protein [Dactylosporangium sp. AC04546]
MTVFAALGDSTTAGFGDRMPDGTWRGWAPILAEAVGARLHNFATSGARAHDVEHHQLPRAVALQPDVAAVLIGTNDTLRDPFDAQRLSGHLERTVATLRAGGAEVLTIRLPDPGRMFGLPGPLARPLARRMAELNAVADLVAARYDTVHFDAAGDARSYDRRMWSVDRLHPSERGHRFLACSFYDLLLERGSGFARTGERPDPDPSSPPPSRAAMILWMATAGTRWMIRRSTDLLPGLLRLAWSEWRHGSPMAPADLLDLQLPDSVRDAVRGDNVSGKVA